LIGTEAVLLPAKAPPFCKEKWKPDEEFVSDQKLSVGENGTATLCYSDF